MRGGEGVGKRFFLSTSVLSQIGRLVPTCMPGLGEKKKKKKFVVTRCLVFICFQWLCDQKDANLFPFNFRSGFLSKVNSARGPCRVCSA